MRNISCDVAIIGAGTAGLAARAAAVEAGANTIIIEGGTGGTTCARFGCMPSKLLLRAGAAARAVRHAPYFGIPARLSGISGKAVLKRVRRERDYFVDAVLKDFAKIPAAKKIHGHARFAGRGEIVIDDKILVHSKAIVIAAGAQPAVPDELQNVLPLVYTHETLFELKELPKSIAIIGAGPLGIEFAVAFARLGVRTAVFDTGSALAGIVDPDVQAAASKSIAQELDVHLDVKFEARPRAGGLNIRWQSDSGESGSSTFECALAASGRLPHLDNLDLKMAGLELGDRSIPIFNSETMQCGDSGIFIAGDVNNDRPILHEASRQGELAGRNAARFPKIQASLAGPPFAIVFTDPDIAKVGAALKDLGNDGVEGGSDDNGRARVDCSNNGLLKVYARQSNRIVAGGEMFGLNVEHLAHLLAWAVQLQLTVDDMLNLPFYHPTVEEGLRTALRDLKRKLR